MTPTRLWQGRSAPRPSGADTAPPTLVTAHRGSSAEAPENTLSAIRLAMAQGADWIEIDVQEAGDGTLILLHDRDLRRVAGDPRRAWELDRASLARLEVGTWFSPDFAGEPIPTLSEVLEVTGGRVGLNIELKRHGRERRLVETAVSLVQAASLGTRGLLTCTDLDTLYRIQMLAPGLPIGWIRDADPGDPRGLGLDALSLHRSLARPRLIHACREAGVETHIWTVNARAEMVRLAALGVTSIITDVPTRLRAVLAGGVTPPPA